MSIINSVVQGKRAYMLADRAITDREGRLVGTGPKFIKGLKFPWCATVTGHQLDWHELAARLGAYRTNSPRNLTIALTKVLRDMSAARPDMSCGMHVGMWSGKQGRAILAVIANSDLHFPGIAKAFEPVEVTHIIGGTHTVAELMGREVDFCDPASFDPKADGVTLMRAQRRLERFERAYEIPAHRIGGAIEIATIGRRGVKVEALWLWPDVLGEMVDPAHEGCPFDPTDPRCQAFMVPDGRPEGVAGAV